MKKTSEYLVNGYPLRKYEEKYDRSLLKDLKNVRNYMSCRGKACRSSISEGGPLPPVITQSVLIFMTSHPLPQKFYQVCFASNYHV